jgi:hypothetical protein
MRNAILLLVLVMARPVSAETRITEYPDRIVVEITGSAPPRSDNAPEKQPSPPGTEERIGFLTGQIEQLKMERDQLAVQTGGESAEELRQKRVKMNEKYQLINKYSAELGQLRAKAEGGQ